MSLNLIAEYDSILLGNKHVFSKYLFSYREDYNQKNALLLFQYVIETYLKWTPKEAEKYLNRRIIDKMRLNILLRYIVFPPEFDPDNDYYYIVHLIYPNVIKINLREKTINVYQKVLSGEVRRFPKEFAYGERGYVRVCICFQYMLEQYLRFSSIEEMYKFFITKDGLQAIKDYKLYVFLKDYFELPIDYLHASLPSTQKNGFLYHKYKFNQLYKRIH